MAPKRKADALTHDELWDDSVLLDSWNAAKAEFEKYHSLHARGIKVEEALREYDEAENAESAEPDMPGEDEFEGEGGEVENVEGDENLGDDLAQEEEKDDADAKPQQPQHAGIGASLPQSLAVGPQDEALKQLLMSWYYAGYYTGLYEGMSGARKKEEG